MPEPSQLVLLEQLHTVQSGTKVRFLACVHAYDSQQAQLTLRNKYPATSPNVPTAIVNLDNVLENVRRELVEVGAWVNVIGPVRSASSSGLSSDNATQPNATVVDATMIWSTGSAIRLDEYNSAVREYQTSSIDDR